MAEETMLSMPEVAASMPEVAPPTAELTIEPMSWAEERAARARRAGNVTFMLARE